MDFESYGERPDVVQADIALATLNAAHVGAVEAGEVPELFLAEGAWAAEGANARPEGSSPFDT